MGFRDDEVELLYKVLSVYKYKQRLLRFSKGLVLPNSKVVKVNDPTWVGNAINLINELSYLTEYDKLL